MSSDLEDWVMILVQTPPDRIPDTYRRLTKSTEGMITTTTHV